MRVRGVLRSWLVAACLAGSVVPGPGRAEQFVSPDILVLGDSQISFGSGPVFVDFMSEIARRCQPDRAQARALEGLGKGTVGVIGVRSSSIHSWVARRGAAKGSICDVDPTWKVNAGTYGIVNTTENAFKQMGQGAAYQFCEAGLSPFEAMFREGYYAPGLLVLSFLGNAAERWADPARALADVRALERHLPEDLACVFMTTAPAHTTKVAALREKAQENIRRAFEQSGNRCSFVAGITPETQAVNQSTPAFFRRHADGRVKDPYHPIERGARHHFEQRGPALCEAIFAALEARPPRR